MAEPIIDPTINPANDPNKHTASWRSRLGRLGGHTLLILLVLALIVAAADRSKLSWDWSADRRFSLSPALVALLKQQQEPLELISIWPIEVDDLAKPIMDGLRIIAQQSAQIHLRHIDPILHKPSLAAFEADFGPASLPALYLVRRSQKRAFHIPVNGGTRFMLQREIGGALVALGESKTPSVSFLQGHGELRPNGGDDDGANEFIRTLELGGLRVDLCEPARDGTIDAASLLIIAGATTPLGPDLALVKTHLADGGATLILGDDRMPSDLGALLRMRGILMGPSLPEKLPALLNGTGDITPVLAPTAASLPPRIIVSLHQHVVGQNAAFPHHNLLLSNELMNPQHAAVQRALTSGQSILSPWTTPVQLLQPKAFDDQTRQRLEQAYATLETAPFTAETLLQSAPADAWVKERAAPLLAPSELDKQPPLPISWAIESQIGSDSVRDERSARIVVWGSRQAASDGVLSQRRFANATYLLDTARWCLHRDRASAIPDAETKIFRVDASDTMLLWLAAFLIAVVPCLCIGVAILTWWDRR
jgi:ABC-type uncharacterized transport system